MTTIAIPVEVYEQILVIQAKTSNVAKLRLAALRAERMPI